MAFIQKSGSRYTVRQGNNAKPIGTFGTRAGAVAEMERVHAKYKPLAANKGKRALSRLKRRIAGLE